MADESIKDASQRAKRKAIFYGMPTAFLLYFAVMAYCTQQIAAEVDYNSILGGVEICGYHFYVPWAYDVWKDDPNINTAIPHILNAYKFYPIISIILGVVVIFFVYEANYKDTSYGDAEFAKKKDIDQSDLGHFETKNSGEYVLDEHKHKVVKNSGVVIGRNPYTKELMLHNGPEHILLMAPTRSGKGVNTIIPTGIVWKASMFFFDPKGELWTFTSGYRKRYLHQRVFKFEPLCRDGSTNRWNPLAEINFRSAEEWADVTTIVSVMVKPDGEKKGGGDPFWDNSATALLNGVIIHLMYARYKEGLPLPCPTDIMTFLSSPDKDTKTLFGDMMTYPHISVEEFLEEQKFNPDGTPVLDKDGHPVYYKNPLKEIYGENYVSGIHDINKALRNLGCDAHAKTVSEIRDIIRDAIHNKNVKELRFSEDEDEILSFDEDEGINWVKHDPDDKSIPFHRLLTHPKVAQCAANIRNGAEQTTASIMQTAQTALGIYQNPLVQRNTAVSDFCIRDLLDPKQAVSCYMVMQVNDIQTVKPISRLFVNTILNKLIRDMVFEKGQGAKKAKKQRLLLMLDEFPQLGNMSAVESALAICAGYGIKMCIVCQDVNQLNKEYTENNSVASNCHLHIYFTPNLDTNGGKTAEAISKTLGKYTTRSINHSDGGGGFAKGSNSYSGRAESLMSPDQISRMSSKEELVLIAGHKPVKGNKLFYFKEKWFTERTNISAPDFSDTVTRVETYDALFKLYEAETLARQNRIKEIQAEKEKLARQEAQHNGQAAEKPADGQHPQPNEGATAHEAQEAKTVDAEGARSQGPDQVIAPQPAMPAAEPRKRPLRHGKPMPGTPEYEKYIERRRLRDERLRHRRVPSLESTDPVEQEDAKIMNQVTEFASAEHPIVHPEPRRYSLIGETVYNGVPTEATEARDDQMDKFEAEAEEAIQEAKKAETAGVEETTSVNVPNMLFAFNKGIKSGKAKNENEAS